MGRRSIVEIGDIVEIQLSDGRNAYGQYLYLDREQGPLLKILDCVTDERVSLDELGKASALFPPIITGLMAAVQTGKWKIIGNLPVGKFRYPKFVTAVYDERTGIVRNWYLWDGKRYTLLGKSLPNKFKGLEYLIVWSHQDVIDRIETGMLPYPYNDLIKMNCFEPRLATD